MRIGIFDPYLDSLGGGEKYMLTAASCLSKEHEVFVFWDQDLLGEAAKKFNLDLSRVKVVENIFNYNLPAKLYKSKEYDAIFFLSDGSLPFVHTKLFVHFQFPVEWVNPQSFMNKKKIKRVEKFICNSKYTKDFIDKEFGVSSIVLYPPTYEKKDFPKINITKKKDYILNVGRLSKLADGTIFKKQDFMINAFKKIVNRGISDWELVMVVSVLERDRSLLNYLKNMIKGYPIKIYENIPYEDLLEIYQDAKIYWHASGFGENLIKHPEKAEHFGITTVEAMINGLVPVVINEGGQKEIVQDGKNGYLFDNEKALVERTVSLIENKTLLEKLSKEALKRGNDFSSDIFCRNVNKIFKYE